ncbi:YitT family protein [Ammoniphilus sp. CFH 90114]|uniref:YitT family protein n=1 Tax=Ammoniphilus sp. CFH 90114 TaxID=2493665 RepID=UPI0013E95222|nr:YitT family protein [Ammoniphilus sp. CFH 90114]
MADWLKRLSLVILGLFLTSLGIKVLSISQLTFGGTAGIATIITFISESSWGFWFFIANLPFFIISLSKLGKWFTISSLLSITGISITRDLLDLLALPEINNMVLGSALAGLLIGVGVTFVLNNGSSLGGIHILALYLDERFKINRGITIFLCDLAIILSAAALVGWINALVSTISIIVASTIIGRYKKSPIKEMVEEEEAYSLSKS